MIAVSDFEGVFKRRNRQGIGADCETAGRWPPCSLGSHIRISARIFLKKERIDFLNCGPAIERL